MINVDEAINLVITNTVIQPIELKNTNLALNRYLAEDVIAPLNVPMFSQSAMDGYAFNYKDIDQQLTVVDSIPAGDIRTVITKKGQAVRIFTGSKIPETCDTVVMQELTNIESNQLLINDSGLKLGGNVRHKANQIKKGDVALKKGVKINAAAIGFLSTLGITQVPVFKFPKITVIATGSELVKLGAPLSEGQIYESNTHMLRAAIKQLGITPTIHVVKDNINATERIIKKALDNSDFVIVSGGISVGDYDFVKEALLKNKVDQVFYKIKQKPGKPLFFGKKENKAIFALPGNPAAALSCFYMYILPAINVSIGSHSPFLTKIRLPLVEKYTKKEGRAQFLKAVINANKVHLLLGQDSDALQSFAYADCLVYIPETKEQAQENELVDIYLLPSY